MSRISNIVKLTERMRRLADDVRLGVSGISPLNPLINVLDQVVVMSLRACEAEDSGG